MSQSQASSTPTKYKRQTLTDRQAEPEIPVAPVLDGDSRGASQGNCCLSPPAGLASATRPSRSFRNVKEVPFPGFALVGRKRLTPDRAVFVPGVPPEDDDDWLPIEGVFAKEMSDTILK